MATNNKLKAKKFNKNKLGSQRQKLIKGIAGCSGCSECVKLWEDLNKIEEILGIVDKPSDFS